MPLIIVTVVIVLGGTIAVISLTPTAVVTTTSTTSTTTGPPGTLREKFLWMQGIDMQTPRTEVAAVAVEGRVYVIGGIRSGWIDF